MASIQVIKVGGKVTEDETLLQRFLTQFQHIEGPKILVHGGGRKATTISERLGLQTKMVEGRRVTDAAILEVATMVYGGLVNKMLVAKLQHLNINAIGLSGADGNLLTCIKRPVKKVDYGFVGDFTAQSVNIKFINLLIENKFTPVICSLTHDGNGQLLNTNADTIAEEIARGLAKAKYEVQLNFCFEHEGVMRDINDETSVISEINAALYAQLKSEGIVHAGLIPKLDNAFKSKDAGIKVRICKFDKIGQLHKGTLIC